MAALATAASELGDDEPLVVSAETVRGWTGT